MMFRIFLLSIFSLFSLASISMAADGHPVNDWQARVRLLQDLPILLERWQAKGIYPVVPIAVTCRGIIGQSDVYFNTDTKQFIKDPSKKGGVYATGTLALSDIFNSSKPTKTVPYRILLDEMRHGGEQNKPYSPFLKNGGIVLCELTGDFDQAVVSAFPVTYLVPEEWLPDLLKMSQGKGQSLSQIPANANPALASVLGAATNPQFYDRVPALELLKGGGFLSRGMVCSIGLKTSKKFCDEIAQRLEGVTSEDTMEVIAYGLLANSPTNAEEAKRLDGMKLSVGSYYRKWPQQADATGLRMVLENWR